MTYCVGLLVDTGLVLLSDSRTNAGVDQINTFRKMATFQRPNERVLVLMSAGNLAITQAVVNLLHENLDGCRAACEDLSREKHVRCGARGGRGAAGGRPARRGVFEGARPRVQRHVHLGRPDRGEEPRLFHIYSAGNFIESSRETPYFQIGESKYGKPIIDRVISRSSSLAQAAKCALVSMDSTIRSNLTVGPPLDLAIVRRDEFRLATHISIDFDHEYFKMIRTRWGFALQEVFSELPNPEW